MHPLAIILGPYAQHSVPDATGMAKGSRCDREVEEASSDGRETQLLEARAPQRNRGQRGSAENLVRRVSRTASGRIVSYFSPTGRNISPKKKQGLPRAQPEGKQRERETSRQRQEQERVKALLRENEARERAKAQKELEEELIERKKRVERAAYERRKEQQRAFAAAMERQPSYHTYDHLYY